MHMETITNAHYLCDGNGHGMDIPDHLLTLLLTKFKVEKAPFIWYSCGIFRFFGAICN